MADTGRVSSSSSTSAPVGRAREAFRAAREVSARAGFMVHSDGAVRSALDRLRQFLESGRTLNGDAPRGTYLDILV